MNALACRWTGLLLLLFAAAVLPPSAGGARRPAMETPAPAPGTLKLHPQMEVPADTRFAIGGPMGDRLAANVDRWLLVAPDANPAMIEIFRDRDRLPKRDLVPWAGEFAGKYLTSATQALRLTGDARLAGYLAGFVRDLVAVQDADGYLGPFPRAQRLTGAGLWDLWGH